MVYGWKTIENGNYYFNTVTGAQVKNATITINGKKYTFDKLGNLIG